MKRQRHWIVLGVLYALFFGWYTSFGGPLTPAEIETLLSRIAVQSPAPSPERLAQLRRFMEEDTGDDFVMVNVIDMFDVPAQVDGVAPGDSSDEVLDRYMAYMWPALLSRASHPVFVGSAASDALDLMNADDMAQWTRAAGMRYRSRRDMFEISTNAEFGDAHHFKVAAMEKTIAFPIDPWMQLGDPRLVLALLFALVGCALSWRRAVTRQR